MPARHALCTLVAAVALGASPAPARAPARPGANGRQDSAKLARRLADLKMTELLEAMVAEDPQNLPLALELARGLRKRANATEDQARRHELLQKACDVLGQCAKAAKDEQDPAARVACYRARLDRAIVLGMDMTKPHVESLLYFIGSENDKAETRRLASQAVKELDVAIGRMALLKDRWFNDWERWIDKTYQSLEQMLDEAAYHGAWIRFYLAMVLPADNEERGQLLSLAIGDVKKFADAEDNESGVKFKSLLLSGMCARERREWDRAKDYFARVQDAGASGLTRLRALFETVRVEIDRGNLTGAERQVASFKADGARLKGIKPVAIDLQAALLLYRIGIVQAEAFKDSDPGRCDELRGQAGKHLVDFTDKYPSYRKPLAEIIAPLMAGRDPSTIEPSMVLVMADKEFSKETPAGDKRTGELLQAVLDNRRAPADAKAGALWRLALLRNRQRRNLDAAEHFRQLAEKYPSDPNARKAALNAVKSYEAILAEERKKPAGQRRDAFAMGDRFRDGYVRALEVMVRGWGTSDPKINSYNYELGLLYDGMNRYADAISALSKVPADSELYLPSGFRIQQLQVRQLLDMPEADKASRQRAARTLIRDLQRYMTRARRYLRTSSDPSRIAQVRQWGGECGVLIAQLHKEALDNPTRAMAEARQVGDDPDWKQSPGLKQSTQRFVIGVMLEKGQVDQKTIDELADLVIHHPDAAGTENLLGRAIAQIGDRIERLTYSRDAEDQATLKDLRASYRLFVEKLRESVGAGGGLSKEQDDALKRAMAHAYEFGTAEEVRKSLELYKELAETRGDDANVLRGMARAYRALGQARKSIELYDRLRHGLPEGTPAWWRIQLERLQYAIQVYRDDPAGLRAIALQVTMLRRKKDKDDPHRVLGGYALQFGEVEGLARKRLEVLAASAGDGGS